MSFSEHALTFACKGDRLVGVLAAPHAPARSGVLIVVGGPQYRVGAHRQFVLLARRLAQHGVAALRFDCRGMGDSEGAMRSFESIEADLDAALDALFAHCPQLRCATLWGLCDAASAALMYAHRDSRVRGLVLVNPWVRSEQSLARAHLKHYYRHRLMSRQFWHKLASGKMSFNGSARSLAASVKALLQRGPRSRPSPLSYQERMLQGLQAFNGETLVVLSGNDMIAREFEDHSGMHPLWRKCFAEKRVQRREVAQADHTFSTAHWRREVEDITLRWMDRLER